MQQEILIQKKAGTVKKSGANKSFMRFVGAIVFSGLILFGIGAVAQPTVTALSPLSGYQGATVTITGTGFNATPANNIVYFGATKATVTAGSTTSLTVTAPMGSTFLPTTVLNTGTSLAGWSTFPFVETYNNAAFAAGSISFDPKVDFPTQTSPAGIAIGDIDGDGKPDVAVTNYGGAYRLAVYLNQATPGTITGTSFAAAVATNIAPVPGYIEAVGDLDNDGKLDIVCGTELGNTIMFIRNTSMPGSVSFGSPNFTVSGGAGGTNPYAVTLGDLDGDGYLDLVVANAGSNSISVFRNISATTPGFITFAAKVDYPTAPGTTPLDVKIADMDGDGKRDVIVVTNTVNRLEIFRNNSPAPGTITLSLALGLTLTPTPIPQCIIIADIDGDGTQDITIGTKAAPLGQIQVYRNISTSGVFSFAAPVNITSTGSVEGMAAGDFDGDGKVDIAVTNFGNSSVSVFRNISVPGSPLLAAGCAFPTGAGVLYVAAGDLDGDGKYDLAVTNSTSNTFSVLRNDPPLPITPLGGVIVCAGGLDSAQLTETALGGIWTSSSTVTATVGSSSGWVKGVAAAGGTATITWTSGCLNITTVVTVNPAPTAITGVPHPLCAGTAYTLTGTPSGGTWNVTNTSATVNPVTGVLGGGAPIPAIDTITYYTGTVACKLTTTVSVVNPPAAITGNLNVCVGATTQLSDATVPFTGWTMSNGNATVVLGTGLVTGVNGGASFTTDSAIYTATSGCSTSAIVTINALPAAINGTLSVCAGGTTQLTDATAGLTWTSNNTGVATVSGTGLVTGVNTVAATSTATITATSAAGCTKTVVVTVNPNPTPILGTLSVCVGLTTTLTDATGPGTWASSPAGIASGGGATGAFTGLAPGTTTTTITYTLNGSGCFTTAVLTVNATPGPINGTLVVCQGATTQLTDASGGGTWASSNPGNGSISTTGLVTGVNGGSPFTTTTITYTGSDGCVAPTVVVTIDPLPAPITGPTPLMVCVGSSIQLTDATAGGTWSSSSPGNGSISTTGVVTGINGGGTFTTTNILYTLPTGCAVLTPVVQVTINALPAAITGSNAVCVGQTITLSSLTGGGVWYSSNPGNGSVDAFGDVTGIAGPSATINYSVTATGCSVSKVIAVNALPATILGASSVCFGSTITLSDATAGGTWSSSTTSVATVLVGPGATTTVTPAGAGGGTTTITYTTGGTLCSITTVVTVNPLPVAITGTVNVCIGLTGQLTDLTPGGNWSSSAPGNASVSGGGLVTGITCPTTPTITYTLPTTCYVTQPVTVNCLPSGILGNTTICVGLTTTLSSTPGTGTWSSSAPGTASVTVGPSGTTTVTGIAAGTAVITYTLPTGCTNTVTVNVNPLPGPINGTLAVCVGLQTQLTDGTVGGTWTSSAPLNGSIASGTGVVTGISGGAGFTTTTVTYTLGTGCTITTVVTINANPGPINGTLAVCQGLTTTLTDGTVGGTWSSSAAGNASITTGGGVVTGVSCPTNATITYTMPTTCINTATVTVNCNPAPINGNMPLCVGSTITLSDFTTGGTWFSSNTAVASVVVGPSTTTTVSGNNAGTTSVTYIMPTGCISAVVTITVNGLPTAINGTKVVCQGQTTLLSDGTGGGGWTSGATGIATIDPVTGLVTGVNGGVAGSGSSNTATITYTLGTGCIATAVVTVNSLPAPITGPSPLMVCVGSTITLTSSPVGGTWTSTNPGNGSVDATGHVTGVTGGAFPPGYTVTDVIYTGPNGCPTASAGAIVTINALPPAILGAGTVCQGSTITLSDVVAGGTWASSSPGNGSIDAFGNLTGLNGGSPYTTTNITYTLSTGCLTARTITVNPLPAAITGTASVCVGLTTPLTDATAGGTWSSSNSFIASVGATGLVTGISAGTATITDMLPTGCFVTVVVTVNPNPTGILGNPSVCVGSQTQLSDATGGGTWGEACADIGISGTGLVTGFTAGTCIVTYTLSTGCIATLQVTVQPLPTAILGNLSVCVGYTTQLSDATPFGTWGSSNPVNASVTLGGGLVSGNTASTTATITYTLPTGCLVTAVVTVNPNPTAINGSFAVCQGLCTTLTDASGVGVGTWTSSNTTDATVGLSTGLLCGVVGYSTATITYTLPTGCYMVQQVTVEPLPTAINGNLTVCQGLTTQLSDATGGGTWSSSSTTYGTIDPATGIFTATITGLTTAQTTTITYTLGTGCIITAVLTINPLPTPILGTFTVCSGLTTTLTDATAGGTWLSSNTFVLAFLTPPTGIATGIASLPVFATATVTYTLPSGCYVTQVVTVEPLPAAITGIMTVCQGSTTNLTDASAGGTWVSSNTAIGTVSATGVVTGILAIAPYSTVTITYTLPTTCITTSVVTVDALPTPILGNPTVCVGATTSLSDATLGGTWSSGSTGIATVIPATGVVTGVSPGTSTIVYTLPTGCTISVIVTVNQNPTLLLPPSPTVCVGSVIVLSDATAGGLWNSSNTGIATVGSGTGSVTGVAAGIVGITYVLPTGCSASTLLTVNPLPAPISGTFSVCQGLCTTLTDATPGGTWNSDNITDATVSSSGGFMCGVNGGLAGTTATISYTLISTGCTQMQIVTVNPIPAIINGTLSVCVGLTTQLTDVSAGGAWISSDPTIATINPGTGLATGISGITGGSTAIITYAFATGCQATAILTVNPNPGNINGVFEFCQGTTVSYGDATPGGTWSSSNPGIATITATGSVTGIAGGTTTISYDLPTGCVATQVITVDPLPSAIVGPSGVCVGATISLADVTGGGAWTSSNSSIASVSGTGVVTGVATGTAYITYTLPTGGCYVTHIVNVSTTPPPITGTTAICTGLCVALTDLLAGGTWSSSNPAVGSVDPFGTVCGNSAGTATITYSPPSGCIGTTVVTVSTTPAIPTGSPLTICVGLTTLLTDATAGGTWSSGDITIASAGGTTGIITGVNGGTVLISYTMPTYCFATTTVTVVNNPSPINGNPNICLGGTTLLADAPGGTWTSSAGTGFVTLAGTSSGVVTVTGASLGTATVTYVAPPAGCIATIVVTVNPDPAPITGTLNVCVGLTTALTDISTGGTWLSTITGVATVGSTGIVTGISGGTTTIIYTTAGGCSSSVVVTVNALPTAILGYTAVCQGYTTQLSDLTAGGTWSSSNPGNGSVSNTGLVTGITGGTSTTITYTSSAGCITTALVTVNGVPGPINGTLSICVGASTTLTDATSFGHWVSSNPGVGTIDVFTGHETGISSGTTIDTFMINATGCYVTAITTVNPLPTAILGNLNVCVGSTTQLSDLTGGGAWSISNADATIGTGGLVTGVTAGTATVTYTSASGCFVTVTVTVDPKPALITGTMTVCVGLTTTLSDATPGGTWASSNHAVATIGISSGIETGITSGTTTDTYTIAFGCYVTTVVTVNPNPSTITGILTVCAGLTTALTDASAGGTWTSSNPAVATIGSISGMVNGLVAGTTNITYTLPTGCLTTAVVTVNPLPLAINGTKELCAGTTTALTDITSGGVWSATGTATVDPVSGVVTGTSGGTATITYTLPTGCTTTAVVTVDAAPANITGPLVVCVGSTTDLTDATAGGFWYSSIPPLATVGSATGIVTGVSAGTVVITYILSSPSACQTTAVVTVNALPLPITGVASVCVGLTTPLSDVTPGGAWSTTSFNILLSGSSSGLVYGSNAGTGTVTYTMGTTGCRVFDVVTVNPNPAAITGIMTVCVGLTTQLTDATVGGAWSVTPAADGTISTGGLLTGLASGTAVVTYTLPTGCLNTTTVTVNPVPTAILGPSAVCFGATMTLSDLTGGGAWSSSDNTIASVSGTGVVTGVNLGTATITYTNPTTSCDATKTVTVNKEPAIILGNMTICAGMTTALSDSTAGGIWSSGSPAIGTVGAGTGIVTGLSGGTTTITYSVAISCQATAVVTVNALPAPIAGTLSLCVGVCTPLSDASGGGTWSSSNPAVASIGSTSGLVCGISGAGTGTTATITYTLPSGCIITAVATVHPTPAAISGSNKVCLGSTITLSDITPGGVWTSSTPGVAPVSSTGVVTGSTLGTATISYSPAVGCSATVIMTVNPLPNVFSIFGGGTYCQGGNGVPIGLNGSNVGVSYLLFEGSSAWGWLAGTGDTLHYGSLTVPGVYSVQATGSTTGCSIGMIGTVTVNVTPTVNPTVSLTTGVGDTVCPGTTVTITPTVSPASTVTPTYVWYVNGTAVSTSPTYSFIPANGDLVKVVATTSATCIFPSTAMDTLRLHVLQTGVPLVHITVDPGDTICQYATATFTATSSFGGVAPIYVWTVNSATVASGTSNVFSYSPNSGDVVSCKMRSHYLCRTTDTAYSNTIHMDVVPMVIPHIEITAHPGLTVIEDSLETLTTTETGGGPDPTYQWEINGVPVAGATNSTYSSTSFHNYDSVTCVMTSSGYCAGISTFDWVYITIIPTGVGSVQYVGVSNLMLIPNPNSGAFTIKGSLATTTDEDLAVEITDMLGQVIYRNKFRSDNGKVNQQIDLGNNLANGMYILNLSSGTDNKSFHFVIER